MVWAEVAFRQKVLSLPHSGNRKGSLPVVELPPGSSLGYLLYPKGSVCGGADRVVTLVERDLATHLWKELAHENTQPNWEGKKKSSKTLLIC